MGVQINCVEETKQPSYLRVKLFIVLICQESFLWLAYYLPAMDLQQVMAES